MNVLLLIMDSVQAKNTSVHDHCHDTTPFLSELCESSTVYSQARAPSFFSLPNHASMFSGKHVVEHGVTSKTDSLADETIFEMLSNEGYSTGLFTSNAYLSRDVFGLNRGFSHIFGRDDCLVHEYPYSKAFTPTEFSNRNGNGKLNYFRQSIHSQHPFLSILNGVSYQLDRTRFYSLSQPNESQLLAEKFLQWQNSQTEDWAAVINFMDTHFSYLPEHKYNHWGADELFNYQKRITNHRVDFLSNEQPWWIAKALESLYDGTIRQVDDAISQIYSTLSSRGELEDTLMIVTSDHGEGFGERSRIIPNFRIVAHAGGLHESLLHVPLIVKFPGQSDSSTVNELASLRKIAELIQEFATGSCNEEILCPEYVLSFAELTDRFEQLSAETSTGEFDFEGLPEQMYCVYENKPDCVNKYVRYGEKTNLIKVRDAHNSMLAETVTDSTIVDSIYDDLEWNITQNSTKLDTHTTKHLEDLGYL